MLVLLWILLLNSFSVVDLLMGVVLGVLISHLTSQFWPERPPIKSLGKAFSYLGLVAWDVVVANIRVLRASSCSGADSLDVRWVVLPLELRSPEAISVLAGTITMTPGTVSCDLSADGRSLLVHCLDATPGRGPRHEGPLRGPPQGDLPVIAWRYRLLRALARRAAQPVAPAARGRSLMDRVLAVDTMVINIIALIILFGIQQRTRSSSRPRCCSRCSASSPQSPTAASMRGDVIE